MQARVAKPISKWSTVSRDSFDPARLLLSILYIIALRARILLRPAVVFLPLFESRHGKEGLPVGLSVKLRILTFSNLILRRYKRSQHMPSLQTLQRQRRKAAARAKTWLREHRGDSMPSWDESLTLNIPQSTLLDSRKSMLAHMGVSPGENETPKSTVSLLDALPEFMSICYMAASNVKPRLMELAVSFMLHAALEQILIYGRWPQHAVDESFAWSWTDDVERNIGAGVEMGSDAVTWNTSRDSQRDRIFDATEQPDAVNILKKLLHEHPLFTFEGSILETLGNLLRALDTPILMQLEVGSLDGLTAAETDILKERVGIS